MVSASAPAKIILFGEHAVVYNQPAIAIPISSLRAKAHVCDGQTTGMRIIAKDLFTIIDDTQSDHPLWQLCQQVLSYFEIKAPAIDIEIRSTIPMASGLGSGAAVSTALGKALAQVIDADMPNNLLNRFIYAIEEIYHGTPSGIDNTVIVYEKPIYFIREKLIEFLEVSSVFHFIIADTGIPALTKPAVADVRTLTIENPESTHQIIEEIGLLTESARDCLATGAKDTLGKLMTKNHKLLQRLTVSSKELDDLVNIALDTGALGAKLSGGGRGGNMIALVDQTSHDAVADALRKCGATNVFSTYLKERQD